VKGSARNRTVGGAPAVLAGDFNVMPTDLDVYAPEGWVDDGLFRPEVRDAYRRLVAQGCAETAAAVVIGSPLLPTARAAPCPLVCTRCSIRSIVGFLAAKDAKFRSGARSRLAPGAGLDDHSAQFGKVAMAVEGRQNTVLSKKA
jgi:hypothetical protein